MCVQHCSEGKKGVSIAGLLAVESVHLAHSHQHLLRQRHWRNWTAGLVMTGCLVVRLRLWQPWYTFSTSLNYIDVALNWTDVVCTLSSSLSVSKISSDISLGCSNFGLLHGRLIMPPLSMPNNYWEEKQAPYAISSSCKRWPSKKRMADKFCLL